MQQNMENSYPLKKEWPSLVLLAYPFLLTLLAWERLPDHIPIHWNFAGEADSFVGKGHEVFFMPLINVGIWLLLFMLPRIDPRRQHYLRHPKAFRTIRLVVVFVLVALNCISLYIAIGYNINMVTVVYYLLLLLFLVLGNSVISIPSNYFIGVRTPWTLNNEKVWRRTHRFAGRLWIGLALLFIAAGLALPVAPYILLLAFLLPAVCIPVVYSYLVYRQEPNH